VPTPRCIVGHPGTQDVISGFVGAVKGITPKGNVERRNVQLAVKFIF